MLTGTPTERILWIILILLVIGYAVGTWLNRQRSKQIGQWLQAGIGRLGGKPGWKIVRSVSSGGQVNIADPAAPFGQVQINWALLTRELWPLWAYEYLTGRRDLLAVRANLRSEPAGEVEVMPRGGRLARQLEGVDGSRPWQWQEGPAGLGIATRGDVVPRQLAAVRKFLDRYGAQVQRLSIRPAATTRSAAGGMYVAAGPGAAARPHLMIFLGLTGIERAAAASLFDAVRDVARSSQ